MKVVPLTSEVKRQYIQLIEKTKVYMKCYREDGDIDKLKKGLCDIIDEIPSVTFMEPERLENYGIESEYSEWVMFEEGDYEQETKEDLKAFIMAKKMFEHYELAVESSGSLLILVFGDPYLAISNNDF